MSTNFLTTDPSSLLAAFKKGIKDGHIVTWSCDSDGDFTHTPTQWERKAWMRPVLYQGQLTLNFLGNPTTKNMREVYAVYHGRFIEAMLAHCDRMFTTATATALPVAGDTVTIAA
jgi:hypothetical protein